MSAAVDLLCLDTTEEDITSMLFRKDIAGVRMRLDMHKKCIWNSEMMSANIIDDKTLASMLRTIAAWGYPHVLKMFLEKDLVCVNTRDYRGNTALHAATRAGIGPFAKRSGDLRATLVLLFSAGVDINARVRNGGYTALHLACISGYTQAVRVLLSHREVDIRMVDDYGRTPLSVCARGSQSEALMVAAEKNAML